MRGKAQRGRVRQGKDTGIIFKRGKVGLGVALRGLSRLGRVRQGKGSTFIRHHPPMGSEATAA